MKEKSLRCLWEVLRSIALLIDLPEEADYIPYMAMTTYGSAIVIGGQANSYELNLKRITSAIKDKLHYIWKEQVLDWLRRYGSLLALALATVIIFDCCQLCTDSYTRQYLSESTQMQILELKEAALTPVINEASHTDTIIDDYILSDDVEIRLVSIHEHIQIELILLNAQYDLKQMAQDIADKYGKPTYILQLNPYNEEVVTKVYQSKGA